MDVRFHRRVQSDLNEILTKYFDVSEELRDAFFHEFQIGMKKVSENPTSFHFDASGLRRYNFNHFPYHFLYDTRMEFVRIWVVRHHQRAPSYGLRRFSR